MSTTRRAASTTRMAFIKTFIVDLLYFCCVYTTCLKLCTEDEFGKNYTFILKNESYAYVGVLVAYSAIVIEHVMNTIDLLCNLTKS